MFSHALAPQRNLCRSRILSRNIEAPRKVHVNSQSGKRWTEAAEAAATVKRLIDRDRKDFLGEKELLAKYTAEFGDDEDKTPPTASTPAAAPSSPPVASPFSSAAPATPFKSAAPTTPFGATIQQTSSKLEPQGLSPYMSPDPLNNEPKMTLQSIISGINTVQVVLVLSFSTIIGLMLATFYVVNAVGGVKLAGLN